MYSIVLFMVDTSLSGFFGSGDSPASAVDMMRPTSSSGARPVNSTCPARFSSSRRATSSSKQSPEPIRVKAMSVAAELVHHDVGGAHHDVDAVLRSHHADVRGQEPVPAAQLGVGRAALELVRVRAGADDGDVARGLAAAADGDVPVGIVGGDHVIRGPVRPALQRPQPPVGQLRALREPGFVELGAQVMVVEDELRPVQDTEEHGDRPEDVRRVARLQHREPARSAGLEGQPERREERVHVLVDEAETAAAGRVRPVLVELGRYRRPRMTGRPCPWDIPLRPGSPPRRGPGIPATPAGRRAPEGSAR